MFKDIVLFKLTHFAQIIVCKGKSMGVHYMIGMNAVEARNHTRCVILATGL